MSIKRKQSQVRIHQYRGLCRIIFFKYHPDIWFTFLAHYISIHTRFQTLYLCSNACISPVCQIVQMATETWPDISSLPGLQICQFCSSMCYFSCYTQHCLCCSTLRPTETLSCYFLKCFKDLLTLCRELVCLLIGVMLLSHYCK